MNVLNSGRDGSPMTVWQFFKGLGKFVIGGALLLQALVFLIVMSAILSLIGGIQGGMKADKKEAELKIEAGSTLLFDPVGLLSEQAPAQDPIEQALEEAFGGGSIGQVSVHELVDVLEHAAANEKIETLLLDIGGLQIPDIYLSKAHLIADAVEGFRETGKRVIAVGDGYGQNQYLIASEASEVILHKQGFLFLTGYGRYRTYYSSLLDNLDITKNVFRVGTFKSALEPVLRDDMSPEAKLANEAFLEVLWNSYTGRIDENRGFEAGSTSAYATGLVGEVRAADGDPAGSLQAKGFIDQLMTRDEQFAYLSEIIGQTEEGELDTIPFKKYRKKIKPAKDRDDVGNITVVTVEGAIIDGEQEPGVASGEFVSRQLREARMDENVKAVVLRVDSPGGSVFASELIRNEVQALKKAGKPVVASMSSLAASGGYWISSPADAIFAQPTTLTGSIGIFAYLPTFEKLANKYGVFTDGVGTTPLSSIATVPVGGLSDPAKDLFQVTIEKGYRDFLSVVSEGRGMTRERVDEIGQGRVWIGEDAAELGLVDEFGGLEAAIADAAERAGLEDWDITGPEKSKTQFELFVENLVNEAEEKGYLSSDRKALFGIEKQRFDRTTLGAAAKLIEQETKFQASFSDPHGLYARCLECGAF